MSPRGDWIAFRDCDSLRVVSPDGKQDRKISHGRWETYGWSVDGSALYGIAIANRRLSLRRIDMQSEKESEVADLGLAPTSMEFAIYRSEFPLRGFSPHPNGKSFLTSIYRARTEIYLMRDFDRKLRLLDWFRAR